MPDRIGVVVIGRNEGERLRACLSSLVESGKWTVKSEGDRGKEQGERGRDQKSEVRSQKSGADAGMPIVYVDSGSTDGSVELARLFGAEAVELDMSKPFSAARARNAGFERLREIVPEVQYVQFVDGDCAMAEGWLNVAREFLDAHADYAVVAGRLRERYPERSIYNRLCDLEWNTPTGDVHACGGIAMYGVDAFDQVGGFDETVIAGEEPELCLRLRRAGSKIGRIDTEMALHDAAMTRFGQWWKRAVRSGYAYALGAAMHGASADRYRAKEIRSIWIWGLLLPLVALGLTWPTVGVSLLLFSGYPVLACRVYRHMRGRGFSPANARLYAFFCILAKFPQAQGQIRFWAGVLVARPPAIIEYKSGDTMAKGDLLKDGAQG